MFSFFLVDMEVMKNDNNHLKWHWNLKHQVWLHHLVHLKNLV